jgi:hypothetical protein
MKKTLLFSLVGGIILFVWQFISFAMPNLHESSMKYTPLQDEVLAALENSGLEEGMYMLGQPNPELPSDEAENTDKMAMNMIRGLIICFIIAYIFLWVIRQQKDPTVMKRVLAGLAIGLIGFFFTPYTNFIWFREPDIWAYFADGIVPWVILGWVGHKMA